MAYQKFNRGTMTAYGGNNAKPSDVDFDGVAVTPADGTNLPNGPCKYLYCTGAGNIAGTTLSGATFVLTNVPANTIVAIDTAIVAATSTTATGIYALY